MRRLRVQLRLLGRRRRRVARRIGAILVSARGVSARAIRAGIVLGIIAGASLTAGALAATFYGQFGYHPGRDADAWASRAPRFIGTTSCASCHADQAARWADAAHAGVSCESCHGPLAGHPDATPEPAAPAELGADASASPVPLLDPRQRSSVGLPDSGTQAVCLSCHRAAVGRPAGFPVIDPSTHNPGPACVVCHDPHVVVAPRVPPVLHPIAGLPECVLCHSTTGMRPLPVGHPTWSGSCLTCHRTTQP